MEYSDIFIVFFFAVTLFAAARDIPVLSFRGKNALKYTVTAVILSVCDCCLFLLASLLPEASETLMENVLKNKSAAESIDIPLAGGFISSVHSVCANITEYVVSLADNIGKLAGGSPLKGVTVCVVSLIIAVFFFFAAEGRGKTETSAHDENVSFARQICKIIAGAVSDGFFFAPLCSALISALLVTIKAPYYPITAVFLWLSAYIPYIGWIVGTVLGAIIYILSGHIVYGLLFALISAALFIAANFIKNYIASRFEMEESKESIKTE